MAIIMKNGKKYYPVGSFLKYQHIFYNALDRAMNRLDDLYDSDIATDEQINEAERWREICSDVLTKFDSNPKDAKGTVYALYNDYKLMKDIIGGYILRTGHD